MEQYKSEFIKFMVRCEALRFGAFRTKSGRDTPFFINTGAWDTGARISRVAEFYAAAIRRHFAGDFDALFGPAYKGIPLAVATAMTLSADDGDDIPFAFNRKEPKDHGEGGRLVGRPFGDGDRILIVEDVTTAGTSVRESVEVLRAHADVRLAGLVVSVDRQERGETPRSALTELAETFAMPTAAIVTLDDIVEYLYNRRLDGHIHIDDDTMARIDAYRARYGAAE